MFWLRVMLVRMEEPSLSVCWVAFATEGWWAFFDSVRWIFNSFLVLSWNWTICHVSWHSNCWAGWNMIGAAFETLLFLQLLQYYIELTVTFLLGTDQVFHLLLLNSKAVPKFSIRDLKTQVLIGISDSPAFSISIVSATAASSLMCRCAVLAMRPSPV